MKRTKIRNILLSALLALTVGMPTLSFADEGASAGSGASGAGTTPYAAGDKDTVADPNTASTWRDWGLDYSTQSVGRIWTDKTVSTEGIALTGADGTITIREKLRGGFPHGVLGVFVHVELEVEDRAAARYRAGARRLGLDGRSHG